MHNVYNTLIKVINIQYLVGIKCTYTVIQKYKV